jgi:hypothetical protein
MCPDPTEPALDTLFRSVDHACWEELGRRHGRCGLAAEPGPRRVRGCVAVDDRLGRFDGGLFVTLERDFLIILILENVVERNGDRRATDTEPTRDEYATDTQRRTCFWRNFGREKPRRAPQPWLLVRLPTGRQLGPSQTRTSDDLWGSPNRKLPTRYPAGNAIRLNYLNVLDISPHGR